MYIAIQVQSCKEKLAIKSIQERLDAYGITGVTIHKFERKVLKLVGRQLKETVETLASGYLIAEIKEQYNDHLYHIMSGASGVIRLFWREPITEDEFARLQNVSKQSMIQLNEPEIPEYRKDNAVLRSLEKAINNPGISPEAAAKLRKAMAKIRERHQQYQVYIKNIIYFKSFRRFTGRKNILEFPLEALEKAKRRLFCVPFGWDNPVQLATRLAISMVQLD